MTDADLRIWSASLPVAAVGGKLVITTDVRPWNGRRLTTDEVIGCLQAVALDGPQAGLEWLSEHAP